MSVGDDEFWKFQFTEIMWKLQSQLRST
jgi:hypothetical protein